MFFHLIFFLNQQNRQFDLEVMIPQDNLLTVSIFDHDLMSASELIGETKIDIENRFFSKHRATCGMAKTYHM